MDPTFEHPVFDSAMEKVKRVIRQLEKPPKSLENSLYFIYLFIYLFFIYSGLAANEITVYNKNSYVYIYIYIYMLIDVNFQWLKK